MNHYDLIDDDPLALTPPNGTHDTGPTNPGTHGREMSPLAKLHMTLRGRYPWVVTLSLILGILGAAAGYLAVTAVYTSTGIVSIKPVVERVLYADENTGVMPMFDAFIGSQVELMQSQRVLELAQQSQTWKDLGRGFTPQTQAEFTGSLLVDRPRRSQLVLVSFTDPDPVAAKLAVQNVIDSYMKIYGERDAQFDNERMRVLEQDRLRHSNDLKGNRQLQMERSDFLGYEALNNQYRFKIEQLNQIELELNESRLALAASGHPLEQELSDPTPRDNPEGRAGIGSGDGHRSPGSPEGHPSDEGAVSPNGSFGDGVIFPHGSGDTKVLSADEIAVHDPLMRQLLHQKKAQASGLERLLLRLGDRHLQVVDARTALQATQRAIEDQVVLYHQLLDPASGPGGSTDLSELDLMALRDRVSRLDTLYQKTSDEIRDLGRKKLVLENLEDEARVIRERLDKTIARIEQLNVESRMSGRIEAITIGKAPEIPVNDGKRKQVAVLGGVVGCCLGTGLFLLYGRLDRRLRSSEQAQITAGDIRLLSILPVLPQDLNDPDNTAIAGHSVHHIRTMLQVASKRGSRKVFAITSPTSGTGKTSLTLALGLSFAGSKTRTLLIDSDLAGGGLTRRLEARVKRSVGEILLRRGLIRDEQLLAAVQNANTTGKPVGEAMIDMRAITRADYEDALAEQDRSPLGLIDALDGEELLNCVTETGIENLFVLPIGMGSPSDMSRVSPGSLRGLIDEAREHFDTILIDTGPVPGSIESALVASSADGVILVVSRGENEPAARNTLQYLQTYGAHIEGMVFNRAEPRDIARSVFSSSMSMHRSGNGHPPPVKPPPANPGLRAGRLGPVAQAVAHTSRISMSDRINGNNPDSPDHPPDAPEHLPGNVPNHDPDHDPVA